ncbi:hypothetical protein F4810DRAFT_707186 [Camillea tinctor]|nr:hypothetical protein F4810DRAFT_707186 [Camillea tinctor]
MLPTSTSGTATGSELLTPTPASGGDYRNPCGFPIDYDLSHRTTECSPHWVCAYDPTLSIAGCVMTDNPTAFSHSMYTSCQPYVSGIVQYVGTQTSDNCDGDCGDESLVTSCGPVVSGLMTVRHKFCATKYLLSGSLKLRQLYCTTAPTEYTATLNIDSAPIDKINLLEALNSDHVTKGSAQQNQKWVAVASVSGVLLLVFLIAAIWLYRTRPRVNDGQQSKEVVAEDATDETVELPIYQEASQVLSYQERLGIFGLLSIFLPVPLIVASLGLLIAFWVTPTQPDNETLRSWIIENKLPAVIASCSLVIRFATATQTALAISMVASIVLENHYVGIKEIPTLLIQRSNNGISYDLPALFIGMMRPTLRLKLAKVAIPLCLLTALSTALQFSSAILLSDLGSDHIPSTNITEPFPLGFYSASDSQGQRSEQNNIDYSAAPPVGYPPFAENISMPKQDPSLVKRAFLPLSLQAKRQSLRNFTGYATVIDASTVCVRPIIRQLSFRASDNPGYAVIEAWVASDSYKVDRGNGEQDYYGYFADWFSNSSNTGAQYSPYLESSRETGANLSCTIYSPPLSPPLSNQGIENLSFMCSYGGVRAFAFINLLSLGGNASSQHLNSTDWWVINSKSNITIDTNSKPPWTLIKYRNWPYAWQITLCSTILEPKYQLINAWSNAPLVEKILVTDNDTKALNSTNLLLWLGATENKTSLVERSVLAFDIPPGKPTEGDKGQLWIGSTLMTRPLGGNPMGRYFNDRHMTYKLCEGCIPEYADGVAYFHPVYTKILTDILASPGDPALALQAFWTLVYQSYYYDNLQFFNTFSNSTYVLWESVQVPTSWNGLVAVCSMMGAHLVLFFGILTVFIRRTKFSKVHDPWLAYTQAHTGELADVLDEMYIRGLRDPKKLSMADNEAGKTVALDLDILGRAVGVRRRQKRLMSDTESSDDSN